jgi:hypothetical protein
MSGVADVPEPVAGENPWAVGQHPVMGLHMDRFNDGADLNRELLMLVQGFAEKYLEVERAKAKRPTLESRIDVASELAELMGLRLHLLQDGQPVPDQVNSRIDDLLKRIGEPPHEPEPEPDPVVPADPVRGHPADGPGGPDRGRVGEPLAERAGGDGPAR